MVDRRVFGQKTDAAVVERHKTTLEAKIAGYDALLSRQKYVGGNVSPVRSFIMPRSALTSYVRAQELTIVDI